jgi:enamine deaminase RidA (YjgF/YER057c/UK114 family)
VTAEGEPTPNAGDEPASSPHRLINPEGLGPPSGFTHVVVPAEGRLVYLAGQTAMGPEGPMPDDMVEQFDRAAAHVVEALSAAGARPEDVVSMQVFVTDLAEYRGRPEEIGASYRRHFGKHYPAMALIEVRGLVGGARVELLCIAVSPERRLSN